MFKFRLIRLFRKTVIASFIIGAIVGAYKIGNSSVVVVQADDRSEELSQEILNSTIEALKDEVVETIRSCESGGYSEEDGIIIFDSNNKASIGTLQFQKTTVQYYYKMFYGEEITSKQAVMIALDDKKASELAKRIIFEDSKGWKNWYNCGNKHNIDAEVKVIKKLIK